MLENLLYYGIKRPEKSDKQASVEKTAFKRKVACAPLVRSMHRARLVEFGCHVHSTRAGCVFSPSPRSGSGPLYGLPVQWPAVNKAFESFGFVLFFLSFFFFFFAAVLLSKGIIIKLH